ncbi:SAM-dependent methyltransferase [Patescibacteria group bacterium]|nr:SAM-dependent methyltransferase [Patescibacteria group bacterium]
MNKNIEKIIEKYGEKVIERALVQLFIEENNISVKKNILIRSLLENKSDIIFTAKEELKKYVTTENFTDFVNIFELLIPKKDKKINGAFFTPNFITRYITSETIKSEKQSICDPSCGCGAFLIEAANYIHDNFGKSIIKTIEENLFGADLAEYSVNRAKILLTLLALKNKEDESQIKFNLSVFDSLSSEWNKKFDIVIGNPPYVKFQDLNLNLRKSLNSDWVTLKTGNYNLYFAFFELGINLLKESGSLCYITPNNYFTSLAGKPLREYLSNNYLINRILDFNHLKIFNAQTYTCITFLDKGKKDLFYYDRIDDYEDLKKIKNRNFSLIYFNNLNNKKWRLLKEVDQKNIQNIETMGQKLGDIFDIRVGIATCKDSVYFIDGETLKDGFYFKTYNGKNFRIEHGATKPIAKISDFKIQNELNNNSRRIIFPYSKNNNGKFEIISEEKIKKLYPFCYEYLITAKLELQTRDKGNVEYPEWYAFARTQGLNFFGEKLLTPTFSAEPRFLLEHKKETLFCNGYAIYQKNKDDLFSGANQKLSLNILAKILNSWVMDYYIKRTSVSIEGGYPCYQKNFIELFGIPNFTDTEIQFLNNETDKKTIDDFLIKKYDIIF